MAIETMSSEPSRPLPQPTTDLDSAKLDLDIYGYCLVANAMAPEETAAVRTRVEEQAAAEMQQGLDRADGVNQRVWFLFNKGKVFRNLLLKKNLRELVGHVLGDEYLLSSFTANIANPGGVMKMHTDQWWMPLPTKPEHTEIRPGSMARDSFRGHHVGKDPTEERPLIPPAVACNIMWMLTDFTPDNGATHVVPGTHQCGRQPDAGLDKDANWIPAVGPAGTAIVFEGRLWHSTGANTSAEPRVGALSYFCAPQFRQQENLMLGTSPEVLEELPDELKALIGFKLWQGYGRIESPKTETITRGQHALGELRPDDEIHTEK